MIYLASPYSDPDPTIVEQRMEVVCKIIAKLMKKGIHVICPLLNHYVFKYESLPGDYKYWRDYTDKLIKLCPKGMYVVCQKGWKKSKGIRGEILYAALHKIPITYLDEHGEII